MPTTTNLYLSLQRYTVGQEENFLTEAFAFLLSFVIHNDAQAGARLLSRTTGGFFDAQATAPSDIQISTQISTQNGRPDIALRAPDRVLYIENKLEARVGYKQLEGYRRALNNTGCSATRLVLLSKYPLPSTEHEPDLVIIMWSHRRMARRERSKQKRWERSPRSFFANSWISCVNADLRSLLPDRASLSQRKLTSGMPAETR